MVLFAWVKGQPPLPKEESLPKEVRQITAGRARKGRSGAVRATFRAVRGRGIGVVLGCAVPGMSGLPGAAVWCVLVW